MFKVYAAVVTGKDTGEEVCRPDGPRASQEPRIAPQSKLMGPRLWIIFRKLSH